MIFNNLKKVNVQYGILLDSEIPSIIFSNVKKNKNYSNLLCPAITSQKDKFFFIKSFINIDIKIFFNKEINSYDYSYEFDKKLHPPYNNVHNLIKESISLIETNDIVTFQVVLPYYFLTDTKDLSITLLDPNLETDNLEFLSGSFNIYSWCRSINLAYAVKDKKKKATLKLKIDEPIIKIMFNYPINLKFIYFNEKQLNFIKSHLNIAGYRKNINQIYKTLLSRRPKKLLD